MNKTTRDKVAVQLAPGTSVLPVADSEVEAMVDVQTSDSEVYTIIEADLADASISPAYRTDCSARSGPPDIVYVPDQQLAGVPAALQEPLNSNGQRHRPPPTTTGWVVASDLFVVLLDDTSGIAVLNPHRAIRVSPKTSPNRDKTPGKLRGNEGNRDQIERNGG